METPAGLTRRNQAHLRPAVPPPPGALIPRSWMDKLSPSPVPTVQHSACLPPTPQVAQPVRPPSTPPTVQPSTCPPLTPPVVQPVLQRPTPPVVQPSALDEPLVQNAIVKAAPNQSMPDPLVTNVENHFCALNQAQLLSRVKQTSL